MCATEQERGLTVTSSQGHADNGIGKLEYKLGGCHVALGVYSVRRGSCVSLYVAHECYVGRSICALNTFALVEVHCIKQM
jgi:hypothetical protein